MWTISVLSKRWKVEIQTEFQLIENLIIHLDLKELDYNKHVILVIKILIKAQPMWLMETNWYESMDQTQQVSLIQEENK